MDEPVLSRPTTESTPASPFARLPRRAFPWSRPRPRHDELCQLVYRSRATQIPTAAGLEGLLAESRRRNRLLGVSGLLLHHEGVFVQCLEGPEPAVLEVYASIARDARHHQLEELLYRPVAGRAFPRWGMASTTAERSGWLRISTAEWELQRQLMPARTPGRLLLEKVWEAFRHWRA